MKRTLAALLALVILCAFFFVVFEAEHDCVGGSCRICCLLSTCLRSLRLFFGVTAVLAAAAIAVSVLACFSGAYTFDRFSLITQKIKLSI